MSNSLDTFIKARVSQGQARRFAAVAKAKGKSMSEILRECIERFTREEKHGQH